MAPAPQMEWEGDFIVLQRRLGGIMGARLFVKAQYLRQRHIFVENDYVPRGLHNQNALRIVREGTDER